jgi:hypothetical protein
MNYIIDENAVINQKQPETFSILSKLNILEKTSASFLNEKQEKQLLNYIMDNKISADFTSTYLDLVSSVLEPEKLTYLENNKYLISSFEKNPQKILLEYLVDKENESALDIVYVNNLSKLIQDGDSEKITVLESSRDLGLGINREREFFSYLADTKLSADFARAYLDLFTFEAASDKFSYLENNKYLVAGLSKPNQDRFFNYLVDPADKLEEDLLFAKVLINLAQQGAVSKTNALDTGFKLDLDSQEEKQFLRYLLDARLSSQIAVGYAELANANVANPILDLLKNTQRSVSLLSIGLQEKLGEHMKAAANHLEESIAILGLGFSLIQDYKINKKASGEFTEIFKSDDILVNLQNFKQDNNLQKTVVDPRYRLQDSELQYSVRKISNVGKFVITHPIF